MEISPVAPLMPLPNVDATVQSVRGPNKEEAAKEFESLFASMLIKEMRNTLSEGLFGSESSDVLGGLFDLHMGQAMTEGTGLGIRQLVLSHAESKPIAR